MRRKRVTEMDLIHCLDVADPKKSDGFEKTILYMLLAAQIMVIILALFG